MPARAVSERRRAAPAGLRSDPELLARVRRRAAEELATIPVRARGVPASRTHWATWPWEVGAAVVGPVVRGLRGRRP